MNRKKSSLCYLFLAFLLGGVFLLTSCDKGNDVYNPNHIQEEAKKAFPVKNIDPNQTWEMSSICNASVSVNEKTGGAYTIKVYTENPYNTNGNAFLLAKTSVTDGQTVNFKFDIPKALQCVYVMKVNSEGYSSAIPAVVENGVLQAAFGDTSPNSRMAVTRSDITRPAIWEPNIPSVGNTTIFPQSAPAGSTAYTGDWGTTEGANYIITSNTQINSQHAANFYISGDVNLSSIYCGGNGLAKIFVLPGAKLKMSFTLSIKAEISISQNAILECDNIQISGSLGTIYNAGTVNSKGTYYDSRSNSAAFYNLGTFTFTDANLSNVHFYNGGTITANKIDNNGTTTFINGVDGKIVLTDKFSCENGSSIAVNEGDLKASSFGVAGSSSFYNESTGKVEIKGASLIDSNTSTWDNAGYFKTKDMEFKAASQKWINRCQLYVDEYLNIHTGGGTIVMDGGSYAQSKTLYMDMTRIELGTKAYLNVTEKAAFQYNEGKNGFFATGDYALIQLKQAVQNTAKQGNTIGYHGKLYVASDNHFANGMSGNVPYIIMSDGAQMSSAQGADIDIIPSNCTPGYNSPGGGNIDDKVQNYAYAFEDMTKEVGDYDFNDVVLYVTSPINGQITATLKAAGATKQLAVRFKNRKTGEDEIVYNDVHAALDVAPGTITNTGSTTGKAADVKTFEVGNDFSITEDGDFYIVNKEDKGEIHVPEFTAGFEKFFVPYAIRIASANWKWPKERTQITTAYTKFTNWAQDITSNLDWYSDPESIVNENVIGID